MALDIRAATDLGMKRSQNEDSHGLWISEDPAERERRGVLMVVADGMGGSEAGEVASRLTVQTVIKVYREGTSADPLDDIFQAVESANHVVHSESIAHPEMSGMGTTCTALVVRGADAYLAHVGDSRVYVAQDGRIRQLSQDHSLVAQLVRDGQLTPEQARTDPRRNVVTRSVGVGAQVEVDAQRFAGLLRAGDTLLMCSDGLHGLLSEADLLRVAGAGELADGCREAIALANGRGGHDNITVILARMAANGGSGSAEEVEISGRRNNAWADADPDGDDDPDDAERTSVRSSGVRPRPDDPPVRRTAAAPAAPAADDAPVRRSGRVAADDDAPSRKRTVMWLVIVLALLLLSIGAAAFVLMQINRQSSAFGSNEQNAASVAWL